MTKFMTFLKKKPLITMIIAEVIAVGSIYLMDSDDIFISGLLRYILAFAMCTFLYLISGEKTFKRSEKTTGYILKCSMGILVLAGIMAVLGVGAMAYKQAPLQEDWIVKLLALSFMCLGVGLLEELAFRAIICDAFIYAFRDKKWVFAVTAVLGSIFFGYVHVMTADVSDPSLLAQAAMKTLSTGLWGLCLIFLYWKTRNIWGCAIAHALYDFLPLISEIIFVVEDNNLGSGYVRTDSMGNAVIGIYAAQAVIELIILIVLWKKVVKKTDFDEIRRNW